ncbi:MAG: imidazolonepropionase [Acidimicrobiia bacterium]|nr:imidazolonepropionase [Acidimicrobiia bacterium]
MGAESGDLNVVGAAQLARVTDRGGPRTGRSQGELDLLADGAVAVRGGRIVAVGTSADVLADWGEPGVATLDARGRTVLPGLVECHSHPIFGGERHDEYAERLGGATLAEVAARGGGIWSSVTASRATGDDELLARLERAYRRILAGGVTTLEVKSGYGLTVAEELRELALLEQSRALSPMRLVISFLGAHVVPRDIGAGDGGPEAGEAYTDLIAGEMLPAVVSQGIAEFHDVTVEQGLFTPAQARRLMRRGRELGLEPRVHADAWNSSEGWATAAGEGAVTAEHLTYTPDEEIHDVGATDTVAVVLPVAELIYMTDRRANARLLIDSDVPVAVATDYCSSIHATSLLATMAMAAPWFRLTPAEVIVGATLNAAYSLNLGGECGSLDVGKRGDLVVADCPHPNELFLAPGAPLLDQVVIGGRVIAGPGIVGPGIVGPGIGGAVAGA